jgi:hypothetical protein
MSSDFIFSLIIPAESRGSFAALQDDRDFRSERGKKVAIQRKY